MLGAEPIVCVGFCCVEEARGRSSAVVIKWRLFRTLRTAFVKGCYSGSKPFGTRSVDNSIREPIHHFRASVMDDVGRPAAVRVIGWLYVIRLEAARCATFPR